MPFLVIEGGEGSGKDTQIDLLRKNRPSERTVFTREPGGTRIGEKVRAILLGETMCPETEMLMFLAARTELVHTIIRPAVVAGKLVISNRFGLSTIAYQIYGRKQPHLLPFLKEVSKHVLGDLESPYCILLDIAPEIGILRVEGRGDGKTRFDAEAYSFHERVRQGYRNHFNDDGRGVCINAKASIEEVAEHIADQMRKWGL